MIANSPTDRYCVIGAGSSGLAVAKNLLVAGVPFDVLERESELGGNWNYGQATSSVYKSTRLISSKRLTEYTDFPMPGDYPEFPGQRQVWEYLRAYAEHFRLLDHIHFDTAVESIVPAGDDFDVQLCCGQTRRYRGIVIANGHNWDPNWPDIPGEFTGRILHSSEYKTPDCLSDQRVLVMGAGNSGCDIAVEAAQHAAVTVHSTRRGYHYLPKFLHGKPIDECGERLLRWHFPLWLRRAIGRTIIRITLGPHHRVGLPKPDHKLFEAHPIINSQLHYFMGHGLIRPQGDVAELRGSRVQFADGSEQEFDLIIYATGFKISFPFVDNTHLNWRDGKPDFFLNVFHPHNDRLFIAGLVQPDSGQWGLVDYQAQLIARVIQLQDTNTALADRFRRLKQSARPDLAGGIQYLRSHRHLVEVEHFSYRKRLRKMIKQFS